MPITYAALDSSGAATSWNPNADGDVCALSVSGSTVYAGGWINSIGGQTRNYIAGLDSSGAATAWNPNADGGVSALSVSGSTVYAGGDFTSIGGQICSYFAALDRSSGNAIAINGTTDRKKLTQSNRSVRTNQVSPKAHRPKTIAGRLIHGNKTK